MAERRVELILRLPNLRPDAPLMGEVEELLSKVAVANGGRLSRIERDHYDNGSAIHISREDIVKRGGRR